MSDEKFDAYLIWLGIPPQDQPPNHYRLLAVQLLESNPDVIENAADQRMAYLRSLQVGKHGPTSQRILNELAAAKICLLTPAKKSAYDKGLNQKLPGQPKSAVPQGKPSAPLVIARALPSAVTPAITANDFAGIDLTSSRARERRSRRQQRSQGPIVAAVLGVLLLAVGVSYIALRGPGRSDSGPPASEIRTPKNLGHQSGDAALQHAQSTPGSQLASADEQIATSDRRPTTRAIAEASEDKDDTDDATVDAGAEPKPRLTKPADARADEDVADNLPASATPAERAGEKQPTSPGTQDPVPKDATTFPKVERQAVANTPTSLFDDCIFLLGFDKKSLDERDLAGQVLELSNNHRRGVINVPLSVGKGRAGAGLELGGGSLRFNSALLSGLTEFTMLLWCFKPDDGEALILFSEHVQDSNVCALLEIRADASLTFHAWNWNGRGSTIDATTRPGSIPLNQWVFLAFVLSDAGFERGKMMVRVNKQTTELPSQQIAAGASFRLGGHGRGGLDEVAVFRRTLGAKELDEIYNLGVKRKPLEPSLNKKRK